MLQNNATVFSKDFYKFQILPDFFLHFQPTGVFLCQLMFYPRTDNFKHISYYAASSILITLQHYVDFILPLLRNTYEKN